MNFKKDDKVLRLVKHIGKNYDVQSQVKMQKILYFLSLDFYQETSQLLFDNSFQAWIYGPVQPKAFSTLKKQGFDFTNDFWVGIDEIKSVKLQEFIATKITKYLEFDLYELSELSHKTTPWIKGREGLDYDQVSRRWIDKDEFKKYAKSDDYDQLQKLFFKCINLPLGKNDYEFTYKTEEKQLPTVLRAFFDLMQEFCNSKNFIQDFEVKKRNFHIVENRPQINLIEKIYLANGYNQQQVDDLINTVIFQIALKDNKTRLFFIKENVPGNNLVIKPLFIDANHLIYHDEDKKNKYGPCLVCHKIDCGN